MREVIVITNVSDYDFEMKKDKNKTQTPPSYEQTRQKLEGLPFDKAADHKKASEEIRRRMWERLETARLFREMASRDEFSFVQEELREGLTCKYGSQKDALVRVYSEDIGVKIDVNEDLFKNMSGSKEIVEALIRSTAETFSKSYYQIKGLMSSDGIKAEDLIKEMQKLAASKR